MCRAIIQKTVLCFLLLLAVLIIGCQQQAELLNQIAQEGQLHIVSLGDSYASGEGNPDVASSSAPQWLAYTPEEATECHRSFNNGHRLAAIEIAEEWQFGEHNVHFKSFACSGATIRRGILGPQDVGPNTEKSQLQLAREWRDDPANGVLSAGGVDVVIISIGGNDIGFSHLIGACARPAIAHDGGVYTQPCNTNPYVNQLLTFGCPGPSLICPNTGTDPSNPHILGLIGLPPALDQMLDEVWAQLQPKHILLVSVPDPSRDYYGNFCDRWSDGFVVGVNSDGVLQPHYSEFLYLNWRIGAATKNVDASESSWAYHSILVPLNNILKDRAAANNAVFVDGAAEATKQHGFCAERDEAIPGTLVTKIVHERWFLTFQDSYMVQGDFWGPLHPNELGHQALSTLIAGSLRDALGLTPPLQVLLPE